MKPIENERSPKILVVDDEEIIHSVFDLALKHVGYDGCYEEKGEEALEILKQDDEISVIYLDLNLPDMSGVELCRRIRQDRPDAVINAITGYAPFFDITACYQQGFDDYLEKPVSRSLLFTSIYKALDRTKKSATA